MLPIPEFVRPIAKRIVGIPGRYIPYPVQKQVLSRVLNQAFREPLQHGELDFLEGARVRIKVTDLCIDWLICVGSEKFTPIERTLKDDVCISGEGPDFVLLATRQADPDTLFFQRRIRIEGDTELGLGIKNTMDSMDWEDLPMPLRRLLQGISLVIEKLPPGIFSTAGSPSSVRN
ncbi:MAG: SCP2 sterol-binding domain-containing protein [Xanthomonadales bacterium]|nr:SCP2 sterol-binding domain-containing protein [Xanthomonadales bacterium]